MYQKKKTKKEKKINQKKKKKKKKGESKIRTERTKNEIYWLDTFPTYKALFRETFQRVMIR